MAATDDIALQRIVRSLRKMVDARLRNAPDIQAATVTQVSPLMVRMATAATPVPAFGLASYSSRTVGDRVVVHVIRKELYVAGPLA